jgi:hypothetical protein
VIIFVVFVEMPEPALIDLPHIEAARRFTQRPLPLRLSERGLDD